MSKYSMKRTSIGRERARALRQWSKHAQRERLASTRYCYYLVPILYCV